MTSENRRKFQRILFDSEAKIEDDSGHISVHLLDISLNGALIERPDNWSGSINDEIALSVQLDPDDEFTIRMQTRLVYPKDNHMGLHCEHIDIDSMTNLRRLVELNLSNTELLERELVALG
ncbi:MAG: PilZ domain-containing protein [Gammaproteobacteria bacterium]|nr:PilZ domain-containing protein [Gammaproteobacteria bacterium]